jgi:hypothetical protein
MGLFAFIFVWRHIKKGEDHDHKNKKNSVGDCSIIDPLDKCATDRLQGGIAFKPDFFRRPFRVQNDEKGHQDIGLGCENSGHGANKFAQQGRQNGHGQKIKINIIERQRISALTASNLQPPPLKTTSTSHNKFASLAS